MKILEALEISLSSVDLDSRVQHKRPTHKRTKGVPHVGAILKHIAVTTGMMKAEDLDLEELPLRMALGVAWEEMAVGLYRDIKWQPGELMRDGVAGSPDGESMIPMYVHRQMGKFKAPKELCIEEFKFTHLSCRTKTINDFWLYQAQVMAYCGMHPDRPRLGRFHIMHACGDYQRPFKERYIRYLVEWSKEEIEGNWRMILNHRDKVEGEK